MGDQLQPQHQPRADVNDNVIDLLYVRMITDQCPPKTEVDFIVRKDRQDDDSWYSGREPSRIHRPFNEFLDTIHYQGILQFMASSRIHSLRLLAAGDIDQQGVEVWDFASHVAGTIASFWRHLPTVETEKSIRLQICYLGLGILLERLFIVGWWRLFQNPKETLLSFPRGHAGLFVSGRFPGDPRVSKLCKPPVRIN